jgi:putative glutamine amidotransferase
MTRKPRIAVILDENTSTDGTKYEASKNYFRAIADAGGLPFGIPYLRNIVDETISGFDGLLSVGGRFAYPENWYIGDEISLAPRSERFEIEQAIMQGYLERDKPVLGICAGMQMLGCLHGCRMASDVQTLVSDALTHDKRGYMHTVSLAAGSRLAGIVGLPAMEVNTFHREAMAHLISPVVASAHADDGIIEAIEIPSRRFAIGVQWHQELLASTDHPGNAIFRGFVDASSGGS